MRWGTEAGENGVSKMHVVLPWTHAWKNRGGVRYREMGDDFEGVREGGWRGSEEVWDGV